jgi:hypothetical protein
MSIKLPLAFSIAFVAGGKAFGSPSPSPDEARACKSIASACEEAGYMKHAKEKNLWKDCMNPILSGRAVEGVQVQGEDVQACEAHRKEKSQK